MFRDLTFQILFTNGVEAYNAAPARRDPRTIPARMHSFMPLGLSFYGGLNQLPPGSSQAQSYEDFFPEQRALDAYARPVYPHFTEPRSPRSSPHDRKSLRAPAGAAAGS